MFPVIGHLTTRHQGRDIKDELCLHTEIDFINDNLSALGAQSI
jgi:hypothetical protein